MPYVKIKNTVTHNIKCAKCGEQFDLTEEERQFCLEGKLPIPTLCLSCRLADGDNGGKSGDGAGARQAASNKAQFENFKRTQRANFNSKAGFSAGDAGSSSSFTQKNPFSSGNPFGGADNPFARSGASSPEQFAEMLRKNRQKQRKIREIVTAATIVVIFLLVVFSR